MRTLFCIFSAAFLAAAAPEPGIEPAARLQIAILAGGGARNSLQQELAVPVVVEVRDQAGQPVPDATVTAVLPSNGAGAAFSWGSEVTSKQTDSDGRVTFGGMKLRKLEGEFPIRIVAVANGQKTSVTALQSVSSSAPVAVPPKRWTTRKIAILSIIGGGSAAAVLAATLGGSTAPAAAAPSNTWTPGFPITTGTR